MGKNTDHHEKLFWHKDQTAAARVGDHKGVRVDQFGCLFYNLVENLEEINNLTDVEHELFELLKAEMGQWEDQLMEPLWTEGHEWDTVTWMIHEDYFHNRKVRVKNPGQLNRYKFQQ